MTTKGEHRDYLNDILTASDRAISFVAGMTFELFRDDEKTTFACVRALEIVGEAAKRIPPEIRNLDTLIPWRSMAGIRDKLIHNYNNVDLEIVWETIRHDLPELVNRVAALMERLPLTES